MCLTWCVTGVAREAVGTGAGKGWSVPHTGAVVVTWTWEALVLNKIEKVPRDILGEKIWQVLETGLNDSSMSESRNGTESRIRKDKLYLQSFEVQHLNFQYIFSIDLSIKNF